MNPLHPHPSDADLAPLADVPAPRRSDAAFARGVQDGVRRRRARALVALPGLAAACAAVAFVVLRAGPAAVDEPSEVVARAAVDLLEDDALFALPELEGSSDQELALLDQELDRRLRAQRGAP